MENQESQYARSLIEASLDPLVTISINGKITDVNEATVIITDTSREKLTGTDFCDYFTEPDKARAGYQEVFKQGFVKDYPLTIISKKGKLTDVLYNASVYKDAEGNVLGVFAAARDITETKQASRYARNLIEASGDPLVTISTKGKITDVNQATVNITGLSAEKLIDTYFFDYFTEPQKAREVYMLTFDKGTVVDYPLTVKHKSGKLTDVLFNGSVYKDDWGNVLGVVIVARDVTAQKLLSRYSLSLIEASLDPLVTINIEGKITDMNQATEKITGITRERLRGTDFLDYFTEPEKAREVYQEVFAKGSVTDSPLTLRHVSGKLTDVLFNGSVYKDDRNNVLGVVIVARDVTAQKLLSNYSLSLIEASLDPLLAISNEGKITDMNQATVKITGMAREHLIDTPFFDYFTEPQKAREVYEEVFATGTVKDSPLTLKHINGNLTNVLFNGSVYKDASGNVLGVVVVARDVTAQKKIATELIESKVFAEISTQIAEEAKSKAESATRIAEDAVKAKQQFLSNMSHEIRTPMNAIIGFTKVVMKTKLTDKQREYLEAIKISGDALIVLINDILDLAKVDAGKMTFEKTPFKLAESISAMLHIFETKFQEKNLELIRIYDDAIPTMLLGDPIRLHQVILNLVSNAIKFTSEGSVTISVNLLSQDEHNVTIEFAVTDTGIGISAKNLKNIFENFQQASSDTTRLYGGTGLGLAIVKQLIEPQGGTVHVKSKVNEGSTFSFILSFDKTKEVETIEEIAIEYHTDLKNIKILVVEDIKLNQLLMQTLLDDFGFDHHMASNGQIALDYLKTNTYDIILMDLQMPVMNGFETTAYIREKLKLTVPIMALTADVTTVDLAKCKAVGMNDYVAKPVDEKLLYNKITALLKKPGAGSKVSEPLENGSNAVKTVKCTDLKYLQRRTKSNSKLMMKMISLYLSQTPALISSIKQSSETEDWESLKSAAHKIIPSFSIVGINPYFEDLAKKVQSFDGSEQKKTVMLIYVAELINVLTQACNELEDEYMSLQALTHEKHE